MPTYDYRCETCGEAFEVYQSFSDDSIPKCPGRAAGTCKSRGKGKVTKLLSAPAIAFKGSGFYKNDSRSGSSKSSSESSSESKSDSSSSSSSSDSKSSDSKSDKKSDAKSDTRSSGKSESKSKSDSKASSSSTSAK